MLDNVVLPEGYKLFWAEEFDGHEINSSYWNAGSFASGAGDSVPEDHCGRSCLEVGESCLTISPSYFSRKKNSHACISANLDTIGKFDFRYGFVVARIKVPRGQGLVSSFKLLPAGDRLTCDNGEIDIMRITGCNTRKLEGSVQFGHPHTQKREILTGDVDYSDDFHVFACEWTPYDITIYCDGERICHACSWFSKTGSVFKPYPAPFDKPFNISIGLDMGRDITGCRFNASGDSDGKYDCMIVDYVRLYRKPEYDDFRAEHLNDNAQGTSDASANRLRSNDYFRVNDSYDCSEVLISDNDICIVPSEYQINRSGINMTQNGFSLEGSSLYEFSAEVKADCEWEVSASVRQDNDSFDDISGQITFNIEKEWQTHRFEFEVKSDTKVDAVAEIIMKPGNFGGVYFRNISVRKVKVYGNSRKLIAVCGVWEDADNYSVVLRAMQTKDVLSKYVIASFTFGIPSQDYGETELQLKFADIVGTLDLAAIVIFGEMIKTRQVIERLVSYGHKLRIPVITFQYPMEGCINADYEYGPGFEKIVRHVVEHHGCRKIDMFAGFKDNSFSEERIDIFRRVLEDNGIPFSQAHIFYGDFWDAKTSEVLSELLDNGYEVPEAIICANDSMAIGVCDTLRKYGISVPDDVIVTGFDGIWQGKYNSPVLTTCELNYDKIVEGLMVRINEWRPELSGKTDSFLIPYSLKINQSCSCRKKEDFEWSDIVDELADENQDSFRHMLEMGHFVTRMISADNIDEASVNLQHSLWMWKKQYYFICITEPNNCRHCIFQGNDGEYRYAQKFYGMANIVPDYFRLVEKDSGANVMLFRQIASGSADHGYLLNAYDHITLRSQQRFEELSLFVSAMVNGVLNNHKLVNTNRAVARLSEQDYLTGLYNRRGFFNAISEICSKEDNQGRILSLFSVDMDRLKRINDNYGHDNGDIAIQILSRAIMNIVENNGVAARYGGDEFAFVLTGDRKLASGVSDIRYEIEDFCSNDRAIAGKPFSVKASIGISERVIDNDLDIDKMISEADAAMYTDKMKRK